MERKRVFDTHLESRPQKRSRSSDDSSVHRPDSRDKLSPYLQDVLSDIESIPKRQREHIAQYVKNVVLFDAVGRHVFSMITDGVRDPYEIHARMFQLPCLGCCRIIDLYDTIIQSGRRRIPYDTAHIRSISNNGEDTPDNLTPLCPTCNRAIGIKHVYEYIVGSQSLGLIQLSRWFPREVTRYRELIDLTVATKIRLHELRGNHLSDTMYNRFIKALEVPIDERMVLIDAIWKWTPSPL